MYLSCTYHRLGTKILGFLREEKPAPFFFLGDAYDDGGASSVVLSLALVLSLV